MYDRAGRSLAADRTGSCFVYQEIFGQGQNLRFNEITVEKFLLQKDLALKVGFYPMSNDFSTLPYVRNFTNVASSAITSRPSFAVIGRHPLFAIDASITGKYRVLYCQRFYGWPG